MKGKTRHKKVFITGCFDMLHAGHIRFIEEAAAYGDVYVGIGSDKTVVYLKGRPPVNTEKERLYMIGSLKNVKECFINSGLGTIDFLNELKKINPDVFIVNEDGNAVAKAQYCRELGIDYLVLKRDPKEGLPARSTTSLRKECRIPYRLDIAGGWLDQPFVSRHAAGAVLTISIEPTIEFTNRSGLASSTRRRAIDLWETDVPADDPLKLAKILFSYDNPPGTDECSGSQDAIGIVFPGANRLDYAGGYWPRKIDSLTDETTLSWIEKYLYLIPLGPRPEGFDVLRNAKISGNRVKALSEASNRCWNAILQRDPAAFGSMVRASFEEQVKMFPDMVNSAILNVIDRYANRCSGWKISGAGGGGYLVFVTKHDLPEAVKIKIKRKLF